MKNKNTQLVTKAYRLKREERPLCYMLSSRHSVRSPLLHFDEDQGVNRPLRYARNQKSPFEDEQDGNAIIEPVIFEDGMLVVERENQVLQQFLHFHPGNGRLFEEINNEKDAAIELEYVVAELDAQILAKGLSTEKLISISRILMGNTANSLTIPELKRDILIYAKNNPEDFTETVNDPLLELQNEVHGFLDAGFIAFRNNEKDVYYNLPGNKKKMLTVPFNQDPYFVINSYLQSDEGIEAYKFLKKKLKKD
jgi:hypothetical protein|tara:strand:+ start:812 stop:1567 length:756 start_codon:yes stop_codon:yes gene_type:complete